MNMKRVLALGVLMGGLMGCPNSDSKTEQPQKPELIGVEGTHVVWGVETVEGVESEVSGAISSQSARGESPSPKNKHNERKETEEVPTRNEGSRDAYLELS